MTQKPQQVLADIISRNYQAMYLLQGEESYYLDKIARLIEDTVLSESEKTLNLSILYGRDCSVPDVFVRARSYPMDAEYQVVIIKEAQDLSSLNKQSNIEIVERYLKSPQERTILVFVYKEGTLDKRTKLSKIFHDHAVVVNSPKVYDDKISGWIEEYVLEKKLTIDPKAVLLLQQYVGTNLSLLANEINKISINLQSNACITDAEVSEYVGINRSYNVFELQNALARKDLHAAQMIVHNMHSNGSGNSIVGTIAFIFSLFSKVIIASSLPDKSPSELAAILKVHPFFVSTYVQATKKYSIDQLKKNIAYIHLADLHSKGIDAPAIGDLDLLKVLLCKLME